MSLFSAATLKYYMMTLSHHAESEWNSYFNLSVHLFPKKTHLRNTYFRSGGGAPFTWELENCHKINKDLWDYSKKKSLNIKIVIRQIPVVMLLGLGKLVSFFTSICISSAGFISSERSSVFTSASNNQEYKNALMFQ